jgi:hypothetical protein
MKEGKTLTENLGFVVGLDSQALSRVQSSEALLQLDQDVLVHMNEFLRDLLPATRGT